MSLFTPHKDRLSGFESERRAAEDQRIGRHHFGSVRVSTIFLGNKVLTELCSIASFRTFRL